MLCCLNRRTMYLIMRHYDILSVRLSANPFFDYIFYCNAVEKEVLALIESNEFGVA